MYELLSPIFSSRTSDRIRWYLKLYSKNSADDDEDSDLSLTVHLWRESQPAKVLAKTSIVVLDKDQNEIWSNNGSVHQYSVATPWGGKIPKSKFFSHDKLTISLNITFREETKNDIIHNVQSAPISDPVPDSGLLESLALLFENRDNADVVILVNDKEFPVHRAILAARSSVFATVFKGRTEKGKKIKQLNITDEALNENVVREMLRYIYTGKCEDLDTLAEGLLVAARKYELNGLKKICSEALAKNLDVENAAKTLILADQNEENDLKSQAIRFIANKYNQVSNTTDWKRVVGTNPEYYHEVCQVLSNGSN